MSLRGMEKRIWSGLLCLLMIWALLPVVRASSKDVLSVCAKIAADAVSEGNARAVLSADGVDSRWTHIGRDGEGAADFEAILDVYGGPYDSSEDLAACCSEYYETTKPDLKFGFSTLGWTSYGVPVAESVNAQVSVGSKTLSFVDKDQVPSGLTMKLTLSTGVVTGTVRIPVAEGAPISAKWKGVILQGWGAGCACGVETGPVQPFVTGAYNFGDYVMLERNGRNVRIAVKRGGAVTMD